MHQKNQYELTKMCHLRCLCVPKRRLQACNFYEVWRGPKGFSRVCEGTKREVSDGTYGGCPE